MDKPIMIKIKDIPYDEALKCMPPKYLRLLAAKNAIAANTRRWNAIRGREAILNYIDLDGKHAHEFSCGGIVVSVNVHTPETTIDHMRLCEHIAEIGDYHAWPTTD